MHVLSPGTGNDRRDANGISEILVKLMNKKYEKYVSVNL